MVLFINVTGYHYISAGVSVTRPARMTYNMKWFRKKLFNLYIVTMSQVLFIAHSNFLLSLKWNRMHAHVLLSIIWSQSNVKVTKSISQKWPNDTHVVHKHCIISWLCHTVGFNMIRAWASDCIPYHPMGYNCKSVARIRPCSWFNQRMKLPTNLALMEMKQFLHMYIYTCNSFIFYSCGQIYMTRTHWWRHWWILCLSHLTRWQKPRQIPFLRALIRSHI